MGTPRGTSRRTTSNLQNVLSRGRKLESLPKGKKRTRSLSNTRKDNSWMTHTSKDNASERIKTNISKQKQMDLPALMNNKSNKKKKDISKLFERHIETAKINATDPNHPMNAQSSSKPIANTAKLMERLKNEEDALLNAVDIV